jgi:hypothetical protein
VENRPRLGGAVQVRDIAGGAAGIGGASGLESAAMLFFPARQFFLPPHRGEVFKQHPMHNKKLCLFRAILWVGWK